MNHAVKKLFATLFLLSFLALLPMSCGLLCRDSCGCGPNTQLTQLIIRSFAMSTVDGMGKEVIATIPRPFDDQFKTLRVDQVDFFTGYLHKTNSASLGTDLACSPVPPLSVNPLQEIQIINEQEFTLSNGTRYLSGENITSLFGMNYLFAARLLPISGFSGIGQKLSAEEIFKIGVLQNPSQELRLEFTIRLVFDGGQEFLLADQLLTVLPK